jgi:hypothetical protein
MMGGGGMPPMPGGGAPMGDIDAKVQQAVQQAMQTANPAAGGAGGAGAGGKPPKPDINVVATDLFQLKKMFLAYLRRQGVELPPDILDGPNRDPNTGNASASPTGGSDVPPAPQMTPGAIQPIEPIQSASPMPKQASAMRPAEAAAFILKEASDVLRLYAAIKDREAVLEDLLMEEPVVEKKSEDEAIYGKACGPGTPCITASSKVRSKAAAINKIFLARRARAI